MNIKIKGYFKNGLENKIIDINTIGIKKNNIIKYEIGENTFNINCNKDKCIFIKTDKASKLKYIFEENKQTDSYYLINENNLKISLNVLTNSIKIHDNTIVINFMLENYESTLYIEYEVI